MGDERTDGWRWSNVPVPESHAAGLVVGAVAHALRPTRLAGGNRRSARIVGGGLVGGGLLLAAWAVRTVGEQDVERPTLLVTGGPYAVTRNPMYVAWTALYVGVAVLTNAAWLAVALPFVLLHCHATVRREERRLEREFGDEYRTYRRNVRRYL